MTAQLTAVSLFAGVGGFDIALERAGVRVVATCEIDDKARGVLVHRFPNTAHFTDIKELRGEQLINSGFDPDNGIIVGGFPCQDLSVAGRRAGLAGARSGLFYDIVRLLDETKARYFILENVPGLLSSNGGRDLGAVVGALVERGYGVAYRILDAQHFGVPQRRRRIFIVGSLGGHWRTPSEILNLVEGRGRHLAESLAKRQATSRTASERAGKSRLLGSDIVGTLQASDHKFPQQQQVHENKIVVQPYVKVVRSGARDENGELPAEVWAEREVSPTLNLMDNTGDARATVVAIQNTVIGRSDNAGPQGKGYADDGEPMFTIDTTSPHAIAVDPVVMRQREGKPGGGKGPMLSDKSFTIATNNDQTIFTSTVRRLTPVECERLQGFPDGWTAEFFDLKKGEVRQAPDSARYKQMGNAVAVPVVEWIAKRLVSIHGSEVRA